MKQSFYTLNANILRWILRYPNQTNKTIIFKINIMVLLVCKKAVNV